MFYSTHILALYVVINPDDIILNQSRGIIFKSYTTNLYRSIYNVTWRPISSQITLQIIV